MDQGDAEKGGQGDAGIKAFGKNQECFRLQTPHSGYHWDGSTRRFFEGWYFRVTLPEIEQSFAFMYSIDDPAGGQPQSGGAAQILGPDETYFCRTFPDVRQFWAWRRALELGHWRQGPEGYQATATHHQGRLRDPASGEVVAWQYETTPVYGWGRPDRPQRATAGWLSYLPIFEPGWQILMAHGLATGWVTWQGQRYEFQQAPAYAEKNWGGAFPTKWFWLQCNAFTAEPDLALTAAAGIRQVLNRTEEIGLIGIHHRGQFYPFLSSETPLTWHVHPWGCWRMSAQTERYRLTLTGTAADQGNWVRVPTQSGLQFLCRDTTHGKLHLQLWNRQQPQIPLIDAYSDLAGLEVGGPPWAQAWVYP
jgi:tocopherol cyclase